MNARANNKPHAGDHGTPGPVLLLLVLMLTSVLIGAVPALGQSCAPMPRAVAADDPIGVQLRAGQFERALDLANQALDEPSTGQVPMRLHQRGLAQLYLAEKNRDIRLCKEAGLSFMRVVIFHPASHFVSAALIETGRVHQLIGRPDLAARLYERAALLLDAKQEAELAGRLARLQSSLRASVSPPESPSHASP